jgi:hypothetical protein
VADLREIQTRHDRYIDSLLAQFERELSATVAAASARTQARLQESLSVEDGRILSTAQNARFMRRLDAVFMGELDRAGFGYLVDELVAQFPGQLPFFREILETLSAAMDTPLPPVVFSASDISAFTAQAQSAADGIHAAMESVSMRLKNRVLMAVGGLKFQDLVTTLAELAQRSLPEIVGLAETATATYYRVIADRGYRIIEKNTPGRLKYRYEGPFDVLTRPFCKKLLKTRRTYTRPQIDKMDNGQIPNVFISCGGWRCRHQWVLAA